MSTMAPQVSLAQQRTTVRRIGRLAPLSQAADRAHLDELRAGLAEHGWREHRDYVFVTRYAGGKLEALPHLAQDLVETRVDVIVAGSSPGVQAALRATRTTPIVMVTTGDPVVEKLVDSLARPGGNVTGVTALGQTLGAKRLELLKELLPGLDRVAVLANPASPYVNFFLEAVSSSARLLQISLQVVMARDSTEIEAGFREIENKRPRGLFVLSDGMFITSRKLIVDKVARARIPAIYGEREFVTDGGLMFYGAGLRDMYRQATRYVDQILKGAKPADLPIEQPTKFELIVNLKTAKALGVTLPPSILVRADSVVE